MVLFKCKQCGALNEHIVQLELTRTIKTIQATEMGFIGESNPSEIDFVIDVDGYECLECAAVYDTVDEGFEIVVIK